MHNVSGVSLKYSWFLYSLEVLVWSSAVEKISSKVLLLFENHSVEIQVKFQRWGYKIVGSVISIESYIVSNETSDFDKKMCVVVVVDHCVCAWDIPI